MLSKELREGVLLFFEFIVQLDSLSFLFDHGSNIILVIARDLSASKATVFGFHLLELLLHLLFLFNFIQLLLYLCNLLFLLAFSILLLKFLFLLLLLSQHFLLFLLGIFTRASHILSPNLDFLSGLEGSQGLSSIVILQLLQFIHSLLLPLSLCFHLFAVKWSDSGDKSSFELVFFKLFLLRDLFFFSGLLKLLNSLGDGATCSDDLRESEHIVSCRLTNEGVIILFLGRSRGRSLHNFCFGSSWFLSIS